MLRERNDPMQVFVREVQSYCNQNIYSQQGHPFRVDRLLRFDHPVRAGALAYFVILREVDEEELITYDDTWIDGLREVGRYWECELWLPSHYFTK